MDCFTPTTFRPTRSLTRACQRHRPRTVSPSPHRSAASRRPCVESNTGVMYITTDYDRQRDVECRAPTSSDADLIFHMSPVSRAEPSPLSPLLYPFPRPSRPPTPHHRYPKKDHHHLHSAFDFKNPRVATATTTLSPRHALSGSMAAGLGSDPLSMSLLDVPPLPLSLPMSHTDGHEPTKTKTKLKHQTKTKTKTKSLTPPSTQVHAAHIQGHTRHLTVSSPIPIPYKEARRPGEPGVLSRPQPPLTSFSSPSNNAATPLSSYSSRTAGTEGTGFASASPLRRIEGFGDEDADESAPDSRSPVTPSTAYSCVVMSPLTKFLDDALHY